MFNFRSIDIYIYYIYKLYLAGHVRAKDQLQFHRQNQNTMIWIAGSET